MHIGCQAECACNALAPVRRMHESARMTLRIRQFREAAGLTLEQVAERLGMSHSQISRIERGASDFTGKTLKALADLYGVEMSDLLSDNSAASMVAGYSDIVHVPIIGYVAGGAEVHYPTSEDWGSREIVVANVRGGAKAIVVWGDSLVPVYRDQDVLVYEPAIGDPSKLIGDDCVVRLQDGRTFLAVLMPGSTRERYTLGNRATGFPLISDLPIDWAARVAVQIAGMRNRNK